MGSVSIGAILLLLFLLGSSRSDSFLQTAYGRIVGRFARWVIGLAWRSPLHMVVAIALNNLFILSAVCLSSALPGGALWIAPMLGVNSGIVASKLYTPPREGLPKLPTGLFVALFLLLFLVEASIMSVSAIMAAKQAMGFGFDLHRALGMFMVFMPIGSLVLVASAICETFLAWLGPIAIGETAENH